MRAVVYERYGAPEVLQVKEIPKPAPKDGEVLIRTEVTTVTSGDLRARSLNLPAGFRLLGRLIFGITGPRQQVLGTEIAGVVEAVGQGVTNFKVGDRVFAYAGASMGCYAEYRCIAASGPVALIPDSLSFGEAAALSFGGLTALHFLRLAGLRRGERVLVNGASGGVGTAAVQLAKHLGAEVTGVCSGANLALVKSLGADHVIDYSRADFTQSGERYDVIVDTVGTAPYARSKGSLREGGRLLLVMAGMAETLKGPLVSLRGRHKAISGVTVVKAEDMRFLAGLAEAGEFRPVIDRTYRLAQIAEAHRYADTGRKRGNVIVTMG